MPIWKQNILKIISYLLNTNLIYSMKFKVQLIFRLQQNRLCRNWFEYKILLSDYFGFGLFYLFHF